MNTRIVKLIACGLLFAALPPRNVQASETGPLKPTVLNSLGISMNLPSGEVQTGMLDDLHDHYIRVLRKNTYVFYAKLHMQRTIAGQSPDFIFRRMVKRECPFVDVQENPLDKTTCPDNIKKIREYRTSHGLRLVEYSVQSTDYICDAVSHKYNIKKLVARPAFMLDLSRSGYMIILRTGAYPGSSSPPSEIATARVVLDSVQPLESTVVEPLLRKLFPKTPLVSQASPDALKTYRNTTYGFSIKYLAFFAHSKYDRPDFLTLKLPHAKYPHIYFNVEEYESGRDSYNKTFEDFLLNQAQSVCAADGPGGSTSCPEVAEHRVFITAHGLKVHEYYLVQANVAGNDCETGKPNVTKEKIGPVFLINISRPGYPMALRYEGPALGLSHAFTRDLFDTIQLFPLVRFDKEPIQLDWAMRWNSDKRIKRGDIRYFSDKTIGIGMWLPKDIAVRSDGNAVRIHRHGKLWASIYRPRLPQYLPGISGPASLAKRWMANAAITKTLGKPGYQLPKIIKQGYWMVPFTEESRAGRSIDILKIKTFDKNTSGQITSREILPVFFDYWRGSILTIPSSAFPESDDDIQLLWSIASTVKATTEIKPDAAVPPIKGYKPRRRQLLFPQPTPSNIMEIPVK